MAKGPMKQPTKNEMRATIAYLEGEVQRLQALVDALSQITAVGATKASA